MNLSTISRAALVVAHPGHELRVHGWLEQARPLVFILTDGSGGVGQNRLESSRRLLERAGAEPSGVFGPHSDRELYAAILAGECGLFTALIDRLADAFSREGIKVVAGDATEGYNPGHDACRLVIDAAVELADSTSRISNYAFPLTGSPGTPPPDCDPKPEVLSLDDAAFARKRAAAEAYTELQSELDAAVRSGGWEVFRCEYLYPTAKRREAHTFADAPYYEQYGQQQVESGRYREVLRYREHFLPLRDAVWLHVHRRRQCLVGAC